MSIPASLERFAGQLREAAQAQARRRAGRRRLQVLAVSLAAVAGLASAAVAGGWLDGKPAPGAIKQALAAELRIDVAQIRSAAVRQGLAAIGTPIAKQAIVAASLDARHFVWGVPTTTGGYCVGVSGPGISVDGAGCSTASAGMWGSYYDCDGSVIIGGRIGALARPAARTLELRHDGATLRIPIDPAEHGFFIARLPATFFRGVTQHVRSTWPRAALLDARGRTVPPVGVNSGPAGPPGPRHCQTP